MTTSSYGDGIQRSYGELAGLRLLDDLETAGLDPFTVADAKAQGKTLGLGASHTTSLLHRLSAGGRLTRLKKGVYAINDPLSGCPGRTLSPSARLSSLHPRLALVCLPALGIDGTISDAVTLSSPTRTFRRRWRPTPWDAPRVGGDEHSL